ncbi:hypothetical protein [Ereboglobus luteus]|nr:hypothetical protein [Ereboglobus luteus]
MNKPVRPPARGIVALFLSATLATLAVQLSAQTFSITSGTTNYDANASGTHVLSSGSVTGVSGSPAIRISATGVELQIGSGALADGGATTYAVRSATNSLINNAGLITGTGGITFDASGTVLNSGTIISSSDSAAGYSGVYGLHSILVDNKAGGVIQSANRAVWLNSGGTVRNAGAITSTGSVGILSNNINTLIDNASTGLITNGTYGVMLMYGGIVTNSGTIRATDAGGVGVYTNNAATLVSNTTGGLITGANYGVHLNSGGTVANSGTILGGANGVIILGSLGELTNSGLIEGINLSGVALYSTGTITNSGTIRAGSIGVGFNNSAARLNNLSGGLITDGTYGVQLAAGGTVTNSGSITGAITGVYSNSNVTLVSNATGGDISGGTYGVQLAAGGTVTNSGTITGGAGYGVYSAVGSALVDNTSGVINGDYGVSLSNGGTVRNSGTITGNSNPAVHGAVSILVDNKAGGVLQSTAGRGVYLASGGTVFNSGTIMSSSGNTNYGVRIVGATALVSNSTGGVIQGGGGVSLLNGGTVINSGTITGNSTSSSGVYGGVSILVDNKVDGMIQGANNAVLLTSGGTVTNFGTISGATGYGVRVDAGTALVSNTAGATIEGGVYAGGNTTVRNDGAITGNRGVYLEINSTLTGTGSINVTGTALTLANGYVYTNTLAPVGSLVGISFVGTGSLGNSGTITGTADTGVEAKNGVIAVTNNNGYIEGGTYGINLAQGGTVANTNSGTIQGVAGAGIIASGVAEIVNTSGALIVGGSTGIQLNAGGEVTNSSTISGGVTGHGILTAGGGAVISNTDSALITGGVTGVTMLAGGTVFNSGTILSDDDAGVYSAGDVVIENTAATSLIQGVVHGVYVEGVANVTNAGSISGDRAGIWLEGGGTVTNSGTIIGTDPDGSYGVFAFNDPVTIDNKQHAVIEGASAGVCLSTGGTVTNAGELLGGDFGLDVHEQATVTNSVGGLIQGDLGGVNLDGDATITNTGTIIGTSGYGIHNQRHPSDTVLTNNPGGLISGMDTGLLTQGDLTMTNSGTIIGTTNEGAKIYGEADITNNALIEGGAAGITLGAGGTVHNTNNSIIRGTAADSHGIHATGSPVDIRNDQYATITGGTTGVTLEAGGTVTNFGTIEGLDTANGIGVYGGVGGETVVNNAAVESLITGGYAGVHLAGDGEVANSGTILGTNAATSYGVHVDGSTVTITNESRGLIQGETAGAQFNGGNVINHGLIQGNEAGIHTTGVDLANNGTIIGTGADSIGIHATGGVVTGTNLTGGLIQGDQYGIKTDNSGSIDLANDGTIIGIDTSATNESTGIYSDGRADLANRGLIQGTGTGVYLGMSSDGSEITNSGTIIGVDGVGLHAEHRVDITNNTGGLIKGGVDGVVLADMGMVGRDSTVSNSGTIEGFNGAAIYIEQDGVVVDNLANGFIRGNTYGIQTDNRSISTLVTNAAGGWIDVGQYGVWLQSGTVINAGDINAGDIAVHIDDPSAYVENNPSGYIFGNTAVQLAQGGTVVNSGTIYGGNYGIDAGGEALVENTGGHIIGSTAVNLAAGGTVTNSGMIDGFDIGVQTDTGSVINSGTIIGVTSYGIQADAAVEVENTTASSLIQGGQTGVKLAQGGTVTNSGTILGDSDSGIYADADITVVENTGGQIQGGMNGVWLGGGGKVRNTGTILGTGTYGIYSGTNAEVKNEGGYIKGGLTGVHIAGSSTITNTGTIIGTGSAGIYSKDLAEVENTGGYVEGGQSGVRLADGGAVTNTGTIRGTGGTSDGIYSGNPATIINRADALIEGANEGVKLAAGGTVTNAGTIRSFGLLGDGISSNHSPGSMVVTNESTGLIQGAQSGIYTAGTLALTNSGTIIGTNDYGVYAGKSSLIENTTAGSLISGQTGVLLDAGGTVTNSGTILGIGNDGVSIANASGLVTNDGLIEGAAAVQLAFGGTVQNTGTIKGNTGVFGDGLNAPTVVENAAGALISATNLAIDLRSGGTVANSGTIISANSTGISAEGNATITNESTGLIQGGYGISLDAGGTIMNAGAITGATIGVVTDTVAVVVTNTIGGVISGGNYAVNLNADAANEVNLWNSSTLAGNLRIAGASSLLTLNGDAGTEQLYSNAVTGNTDFTGTLVKQGAGTWTLDKSFTLNMAQQMTTVDAGKLVVDWDQYQLNGSNVNIEADAILEVRTANTSGTTTLVNPLTGDGLLDLIGTATVNAPDVTFALDPAMGTAFSGTVGVGSAYGHKTVFDLATSEPALTNATLKLNANSETTLDANRIIGGLDLAGGTLLAKTDTTAAGLPPYRLDVDNLMSSAGGSKIGVDTETLSGINPPLPPGDGLNQNVFDMDVIPPDTLLSGTIVHGATSSIYDGATFDMVDSDGNALPSGTSTISFGQNGLNPVGVNSYGYNAIHKADGSGGGDIVLNYGLISIESVHATEMIILDPTGSLDKTLSAKLTGAGAGFEFRGAEAITLAHTGNDYTGSTFINESAWIIGGVTDVIASSTKVTLATVDTGFDLGGNNQRLQNLNGLGNIRLGDKTLTVANTETGLELSGEIDGTGNVTLTDDSEWTLTGENTYTGVTTIGTGAQLQLGSGGLSGMIDDASAVANSGTLTINRADDLVYGGTVTGAGVFIQRGDGTTHLTGANKIDGGLVVENGELVIGGTASGGDTTGWYSSTIAANARVDDGAWLSFNRSDEVIYDGVISGSGNVVTYGSGTLAIQKVQDYEGVTIVAQSTLRTGTTNAISKSDVVFLLDGTLDLNNNNQRIKNLYGDNGVIRYSTNNGTATAYTNLTVAGELDGTTTHYMNVDLVGKKSDTLTVAGLASGTHYVYFDPTTDPSLLSDPQRKYALEVVKLGVGSTAEFDSDGVESGMHTYKLYKGDGGLIMPNGDSYYLTGGDALSRAADAILLTAGVMGADWHYGLDNVHKRLGEIRVNLPTSSGNVWARVNNYRLNGAPDLAGSSFEQDSYGITAGGDMIFRREKAMLVAGAFFGMSRSERTFDDSRNQYGDGDTNTLGLGLYGLWLYDNAWFVDATLRVGRSTNELNARGVDGFISRGKYTNHVQSISVEAGRRFMNGIYWVEPSAQVAVAWINGADYTVSNGVSRDLEVRISDSDAWQYRGQVRTGADYGRWQPYVKVAMVKTDSHGGKVHVEGRSYQPWFDGWRFETGAGVGYLIDARSQVYFDYEYNKASDYERPWSLTLGYRRAW